MYLGALNDWTLNVNNNSRLFEQGNLPALVGVVANYTPEFRETSGVGKRPVLTPDEVLRLPLDQALIIIRGKKVLQVDKMDYSKHPEAKYLRSCKASAHVPEWRRLEDVTMEEGERLLRLEESLHQRVVGQDEAVKAE